MGGWHWSVAHHSSESVRYDKSYCPLTCPWWRKWRNIWLPWLGNWRGCPSCLTHLWGQPRELHSGLASFRLFVLCVLERWNDCVWAPGPWQPVHTGLGSGASTPNWTCPVVEVNKLSFDSYKKLLTLGCDTIGVADAPMITHPVLTLPRRTLICRLWIRVLCRWWQCTTACWISCGHASWSLL